MLLISKFYNCKFVRNYFEVKKIYSRMYLPDELWIQLFAYLDYRDLVNLSAVSTLFHTLARDEILWKNQCEKYWLLTNCLNDHSWLCQFRSYYSDYGRYISCYRPLKIAWDQIISFLSEFCPGIVETINGGCSEDELDEAESLNGLKFPKELRCLYRLHNGQRLPAIGLLGSIGITFSNYRSDCLLDVGTASRAVRTRPGMRDFYPLTMSADSVIGEFLVLSDQELIPRGSIVFVSRNGFEGPRNLCYFVSGKDVLSWFTNYAERLSQGEYPVIDGMPYTFYHEPDCVAKTESITVSVATAFIPQLSICIPPRFCHAYRITMSMSPNAPKYESCQLESRHWIITDGNGEEEFVDGPGVVGEYPIMKPGAEFSWISYTFFPTTYGNMRGHFTMRNLKTGLHLDVECPVFHMQSLPYVNELEL